MRLLLISSSKPTGYEYLGHCREEIKDFMGSSRRVLNIPYAKPDPRYLEIGKRTWSEMGFEFEQISDTDPISQIERAEAIFMAGGNTFRLLAKLYEKNILELIRERVISGMPYMGASAGINVAGPTIKTTNDMPIISPPSFDALHLVPFQINPHYFDPDPTEARRGETRAERIGEFLEENDLPVLALRETAFVRREGDELQLKGKEGAKLFKRNSEPSELPMGSNISFLLEKH